MKKSPSLDELLTAAGLSPQELAAQVGVGRTTIWRWCCGRSVPRNAQVADLARALAVPMETVAAAIQRARRHRPRRLLPS